MAALPPLLFLNSLHGFSSAAAKSSMDGRRASSLLARGKSEDDYQ